MFRRSRSLLLTGLFVPVPLLQGARHSSIYSSTENDESIVDFTKLVRVKESDESSIPKTFSVGGFQLAGEDDLVSETCNRIEDIFQLRIECTCNLSLLNPSTIQFGCKNKHKICNQDDYCGRPVYTGIIGMDNTVLSSDFCLNNLQKDDEDFGNLCIAIDYTYDEDSTDTVLNKCRAQVEKKKCSCEICRDGRGIRLDCTDVDSRLLSSTCDTVDVVSKIDEGGMIRGYFPSFN